VWVNKRFAVEKERIIAHVDDLKHSLDWTKENGQYIPAPLVYLNKRSWQGADIDVKTNEFAGSI